MITPPSDTYDGVVNKDFIYLPYPKTENELKLAKPLFMYPVYSARFNYVAQAKEDLAVQEGDQMFLVDGSNKDWSYMISVSNGKGGFVPKNYITKAIVCKLDQQQIQMIKELGTGSSGRTWEGLCYGNIKVVVKSFSVVLSPAKCLEEAISMSNLCHPNLTRFYVVCPNRGYFVTEFLKDGSLLQYLHDNGRSMKFPQLVEKASQIAAGMAYLEEQKYIHGNLAARNVLLTEQLVCKVADFGTIPMILKDKGSKKGIAWPDKWTAPESAANEAFTTKSDVWSYGIVLYEIVMYGRIPYPGMTNREILTEVPKGYRLCCSAVCPGRLYDLMMSCWNANAEDHPTFEHLKWYTTDYFTIDQDGYQYM